MEFSESEIKKEAKRLYGKLKEIKWALKECEQYAPITLEINKLKKEQDAIILAHSYQTADIMYGIADYIGDSYALSVIASKNKAKKIIFSSVKFMGETAKLLSPEKEVIMPVMAGCSLAESIIPNDVKKLRKKHPNAGVVCYVNTDAAVKAESDACCTSSNAHKIVEAMPQKDIIFIPDELMGKNLQNMTSKNIILWKGKCIVHEIFSPEIIDEIREKFPGVKILAHTECIPEVIAKVDMAGGTSGMLKYIKKSNAKHFMLITECGLSDRVRVEFKNKKIVGTCSLCTYMKEIEIKDVLKALKNPSPKQIITIPENIANRARKALDMMFKLEKQYDKLNSKN